MDKNKQAKQIEILKELNYNKTMIQTFVLEGENSYFILGTIESLCEKPKKEDYCPNFIPILQVNNKVVYASNTSIGEIRNKTYKKKEKLEFFVPIEKKEISKDLFLTAEINYRILDQDYAQSKNLPLIVPIEYNQNLKEISNKRDTLKVNVSFFQVLFEGGILKIGVEGTILESEEKPRISILISKHYMFEKKIINEEFIEVKDNLFNKTLSVNYKIDNTLISVILMIRTNKS
ncbi:MAG: hypothetical protein V1663_03855, partial [archaeon]